MKIQASSPKTTTSLDIRDLRKDVMYWVVDRGRLIFIPALNDGSRSGVLIDLEEGTMLPFAFSVGDSPKFHQVHKAFTVTLVQD